MEERGVEAEWKKGVVIFLLLGVYKGFIGSCTCFSPVRMAGGVQIPDESSVSFCCLDIQTGTFGKNLILCKVRNSSTVGHGFLHPQIQPTEDGKFFLIFRKFQKAINS